MEYLPATRLSLHGPTRQIISLTFTCGDLLVTFSALHIFPQVPVCSLAIASAIFKIGHFVLDLQMGGSVIKTLVHSKHTIMFHYS